MKPYEEWKQLVETERDQAAHEAFWNAYFEKETEAYRAILTEKTGVVSGKHGEFEMVKPALSLYSCHIEYDYLGKYGDCVDLNTLEDTWYCYPHDCDFAVTKMALATEELYRFEKQKTCQ